MRNGHFLSGAFDVDLDPLLPTPRSLSFRPKPSSERSEGDGAVEEPAVSAFGWRSASALRSSLPPPMSFRARRRRARNLLLGSSATTHVGTAAFGCSAKRSEPVWNGHSCPLPLTLILTRSRQLPHALSFRPKPSPERSEGDGAVEEPAVRPKRLNARGTISASNGFSSQRDADRMW
jgi:hypothetical protein